MNPAGHGSHCAFPVSLAYVPAKQDWAELLPSGQYLAVGQIPPVAPSGVGRDVFAPPVQYHPAAQGPDGAVNPVELQCLPPGHWSQSDTDTPPGVDR